MRFMVNSLSKYPNISLALSKLIVPFWLSSLVSDILSNNDNASLTEPSEIFEIRFITS